MKNLEASIGRAVNLVEGGFYEDAITLFEEIANQAQVPALYSNLGTLYLLENQHDHARNAFKQGIALDPNYQPLHLNLGRLYEKEGKITEAIAQLKKAPNEGEAKTLLDRLQEKAATGSFEQEPNDEILRPNDIRLAEKVVASISTQSDVDFFKLKIRICRKSINRVNAIFNIVEQFARIIVGVDFNLHARAAFHGSGNYSFDALQVLDRFLNSYRNTKLDVLGCRTA